MKYFRFVCDIRPTLSEIANATRDCINEVGVYCAYLSRMYEYYFMPTQTDHVVSITVCLVEDLQKMEYPQSCTNMKVVSNIIALDRFNQLLPKDKAFYIIELCQQSIMELVKEMNWKPDNFEHTYKQILNMGASFRDYWRKAKYSPNRHTKAQIYFEDDYENDGIYVCFTDQRCHRQSRVKFAPKGFLIHSKGIGGIRWYDDSHIIIPLILGHTQSKGEYWIVGTDGSVDFHYSRADGTKATPHGTFDLGILYWEGKIILQDKDKGLELIRKAAELNYKHAQKWLERNIKYITANKQQTD